MAKFSKAQMKQSLLKGLSLMVCEGGFEWATLEEIEGLKSRGFMLFNDEKRNHYDKMSKKGR